MTENEVLFEISSTVNGHHSFAQAVEKIALLLKREAHGEALFVDAPGAPDAAKFLDSIDKPYRSLFSVNLRAGGEALGRLTLCFASDEFQGTLPQRLAEFVGEQLGMLLARTHLSEQKAQWRREIEQMEADLASRKLMQRAEGLLVSRRGMTAAAASRWMAQQSQRTGLSPQIVADRIIAYYQATGLLEQKIA
jgi:hypothetical protein